MRRAAALAWLLGCTACAAAPPGLDEAVLARAAAAAGVAPQALHRGLRPDAVATGAGRARPSALLRELQAAPLAMPARARALRSGFAQDAGSATALVARAAGLYLDGATPAAHGTAPAADGVDPLVDAMARLQPGTGFVPPPDDAASRPLRTATARVLAAIAQAEHTRRQALAGLPATLTLDAVVAQATGQRAAQEGEPALETVLPRIDRVALAAGMQGLIAAVQDLAHFLAQSPALPAVSWQWSTPLGEVVVDTTGRDDLHRLRDPLLVVDVGGDDRYVFTARSPRNRIAIVLDHGGNDRYTAEAPAADASAGVLGYGIVWDTLGDDHYAGGLLAQGAAVLGAALHVDGAGDDHYEAEGFAQGFALGGLSVLLSRGGNDRFTALTHAQGSAGPEAVAVLLDTAGHDDYRLRGDPLLLPSSQLPDRNVSLGQGAARGVRASANGPAAPGGIALLIDLAGDDHYRAEVFAQGAGYFEGVGMLIDGGGHDRYEAAWYAMGAAAHGAAGLLLDEGSGDDRYSASHSTALGAAHDASVAYFQDDGGNDAYRLGDLGLGAAQDGSVAVFVEAAGDDRYASDGCHAFGFVRNSSEAGLASAPVGLGLFFDLAGTDHYPPPCGKARDGATWHGADAEAGTAIGVDLAPDR